MIENGQQPENFPSPVQRALLRCYGLCYKPFARSAYYLRYRYQPDIFLLRTDHPIHALFRSLVFHLGPTPQDTGTEGMLLENLGNPLVCVMATQRAGTNALRGILVQSTGARDFSEIFQRSKKGRWGFYTFLQARPYYHDLFLGKAAWGLETVLREYFTYLCQENEKGAYGIFDVKLNQVAPFIANTGGGKRQMLRDLIAANEIKVVHLARRDLFAQSVSYCLSECSGLWIQRGRHIDTTRYRLDPARILQVAASFRNQNALFAAMFQGYDHVLSLAYEDLFQADNTMQEETRQRLEQFLGVSIPAGAVTPLTKISAATAERIANPEELLAAFSGTCHEASLRTLLQAPA